MVAAASGGLDLATAKGLTEEGCRLSIYGRNHERLDRAVDQLRRTGAEVLARATECN